MTVLRVPVGFNFTVLELKLHDTWLYYRSDIDCRHFVWSDYFSWMDFVFIVQNPPWNSNIWRRLDSNHVSCNWDYEEQVDI